MPHNLNKDTLADLIERTFQRVGSLYMAYNDWNAFFTSDAVSNNYHLWSCLRLGLSWFNWWVSFAPEFQCCYLCESSCLFYLSFNFDFCVSKIMHL